MGAPLGNKNAASARLWRAAILRAIERKHGRDQEDGLPVASEGNRGLAYYANKFLALAESADEGVRLAFFREFGDRIEGKSLTPIEHSGGASPIEIDVSNRNEIGRRIAWTLMQAALQRAHDSQVLQAPPNTRKSIVEERE